MISVSNHAVLRYQERVARLEAAEVRERIRCHSDAIETAIEFGAPCVRLPDGTGLILKNGVVATVLGRKMPLGPRFTV